MEVDVDTDVDMGPFDITGVPNFEAAAEPEAEVEDPSV